MVHFGGRIGEFRELMMFRSDPIPSLLFRAQRHGEDREDGREDDREGGRAAHRGAPAAGRDPGAVCSYPGIFWLHLH